MSRFRVISVDDEASAHDALGALLRSAPYIDLALTCTSASQAMRALDTKRYDLLFLDIAMPEMSGLDLLRTLAAPPLTVLLTARVEHALAAFDLGVRDYLLKPVSAERIHHCLERIRPLLDAARDNSAIKPPPRLSIKCGETYRLVDPGATVRIEAAGNFSVVHSGDTEILASETMKELERRLAPFGFVRIHKSHLVNIRFIRWISTTGVRMENELTLPMGRAYRGAATNFIGTAASPFP